MTGNTPRGNRKRLNAAGEPRYQVHYLIRDPEAPSGCVESSATFPTLREAKAFKSERDNEAPPSGHAGSTLACVGRPSAGSGRSSATPRSRRCRRRPGAATPTTGNCASNRGSARSPAPTSKRSQTV
jgi:hypothetical protein